ncbi:MAG: FAD-dependent monooxygenase [Pseudomonadota bacterium]
MAMAVDFAPFPYVAPLGLAAPEPRHPVAIVGAGPIGLALAIDLAQRGVASVVLDDDNRVATGSRAICWAKRTLEIFDRLGVGARMLEKGVTWKTGRQFHKDKEVYSFDLLPEDGHKYPAFVNLQQYYVEQYLVERAQDLKDLIDLRFLNRVTAHQDHGDHLSLDIETPDGAYRIEADWLVACDGAHSPTRARMDLPFNGESFEENFLIVDVEMAQSPFGNEGQPERWFWFEPPFHNGQSALLHKQPDNIYRIDLQLGPDADTQEEAKPERVVPRIKAIVGNLPFRLEWTSVYRFRCARIDRFVHGRVVFAGDCAHVVSPFGARGGNGGVQDADALGWRLAAIIKKGATPAILQDYNAERVQASDENILHSSRATNFMTPKSPVEALFRTEVLRLARRHPFARKLINSGRLSQPCHLHLGDGHPLIGRSVIDTPLEGPDGETWLTEVLPPTFCLLKVGPEPMPQLNGVVQVGIGHTGPYPSFKDLHGLAAKRYGTDCAFLFRPDGHICAAIGTPAEVTVAEAVSVAMAGR